jgi:thioredoxin reductase (NADPH)
VKTTRGDLKTYGILLATGAHPRMIGFKGEEEFRGRGVAYCATCDGEFFTGKEVFVVGGGFAAAEEAVFLTKYAKHVNILIRKDDFSCAAATAEAAKNHEKITVIYNTVVEEVFGDSALRGIRYKNTKTGEVTEYKAVDGDNIGVFVFAGYQPATSLVKGVVDLDESGYIITDRVQKTNVDGIYAAGDVCIKPLRQVVTAVGDGALAATELEKYAAKMHKKTGVIPRQPQKEKVETAEKPESEKSVVQHSANSGLFDDAMLAQLNAVFSRMENPLILKLYLDNRPVSEELRGYMEELAKLTDKLSVDISKRSTEADPCVEVCRQDGEYTGLAFHGVPGGHEFTSFVLGLYNAAGQGQKIDDDVAEAVSKIERRVDFKVLVSLSCTMCPDLVIAAQKLASLNKNVTAEVYDLNHFPEIKDQYQVMSVPCLVINDGEKVTFGKKNIRQILEVI